jgi:hypothetical protein
MSPAQPMRYTAPCSAYRLSASWFLRGLGPRSVVVPVCVRCAGDRGHRRRGLFEVLDRDLWVVPVCGVQWIAVIASWSLETSRTAICGWFLSAVCAVDRGHSVVVSRDVSDRDL